MQYAKKISLGLLRHGHYLVYLQKVCLLCLGLLRHGRYLGYLQKLSLHCLGLLRHGRCLIRVPPEPLFTLSGTLRHGRYLGYRQKLWLTPSGTFKARVPFSVLLETLFTYWYWILFAVSRISCVFYNTTNWQQEPEIQQSMFTHTCKRETSPCHYNPEITEHITTCMQIKICLHAFITLPHEIPQDMFTLKMSGGPWTFGDTWNGQPWKKFGSRGCILLNSGNGSGRERGIFFSAGSFFNGPG